VILVTPQVHPFAAHQGVTVTDKPSSWLTVAQVAHDYGVTERFIRSLIAAGTLPASRVGGRAVRIRRIDADALAQPIRDAAPR
jgi:excisionase family DNA binding protein